MRSHVSSQAAPLVLGPGFLVSALETASAHSARVVCDPHGSCHASFPSESGILPCAPLWTTYQDQRDTWVLTWDRLWEAWGGDRGSFQSWYFWFVEPLWSQCSGNRASNGVCWLMCNNYTVINHAFRCCVYRWDHWRVFISFVMQRQIPSLLHVYRAPESQYFTQSSSVLHLFCFAFQPNCLSREGHCSCWSSLPPHPCASLSMVNLFLIVQYHFLSAHTLTTSSAFPS